MSMLSMRYTSSLLGREAFIDFPDSQAAVHYTTKGEMLWRVEDCQGHVSEGRERLSYLQVSDDLHFLNWRESNGFTVSQVIDTARGVVQAFWSLPDERADKSQRTSMFVEGRFRLKDRS